MGALARSPRALSIPALGSPPKVLRPRIQPPSLLHWPLDAAAYGLLTELIEVSLNAILARHRADQPRLQERAPLVDQAAVAAVIVLGDKGGGWGPSVYRSAWAEPG